MKKINIKVEEKTYDKNKTIVNENLWTHQLVIITMDGQIGYADGQIGWAGYGQYSAA